MIANVTSFCSTSEPTTYNGTVVICCFSCDPHPLWFPFGLCFGTLPILCSTFTTFLRPGVCTQFAAVLVFVHTLCKAVQQTRLCSVRALFLKSNQLKMGQCRGVWNHKVVPILCAVCRNRRVACLLVPLILRRPCDRGICTGSYYFLPTCQSMWAMHTVPMEMDVLGILHLILRTVTWNVGAYASAVALHRTLVFAGIL